MNDTELLTTISNKLNALLFVLLTQEAHKKTNAEKVAFLARLGITNQDIADIVGTTKGTVEVLKSRANKKAR
jgi:DNA-binding CsgD family transcriptional regulator